MTRDETLLARATGALRESGNEGADDATRTRARVVRRVRLRRASRQLGLVLAALALVFVGVPGAWALATGRAPAWAEPILRVLVSDASTVDADELAVAPVRSHARPTVAAAVAVADTAPVADTVAVAAPVAVAVPVAVPAPVPVPVAVSVPDTVTAAAPAPVPVARHASPRAAPPDADALYLEAHELHFVSRDPARALAAWDRYLAAAPDGRFAVEARYNRALDLVRLGRLAAARAALAPFASGELEGYRRREAEALLTALSAEP